MMTNRLRQIRRDRGEAGSALVMALLFLALFGLLTAALLSFGFAGERTQGVVRSSRDARYAADGAIEGAIRRFQAMQDAGVTDPCTTGGTPFFSYTVRDKTATVSCSGTPGTGATPNPPTELVSTGATSPGGDFVPVNCQGTNKTLVQTLEALEASGACGTIAKTTYAHTGPNVVTLTYANSSPPAGANYRRVDVLVSHMEGNGPGDAPNQSQSVNVVTDDDNNTSNGVVNCGAYDVIDAKASGGPSWPIPAYATIDVTYQSGHQDDPAYLCLSTPTRVQNASITYSAQATCAPSCGSTNDVLDSILVSVRLVSRPATSSSTGTLSRSSCDLNAEHDFLTAVGNLPCDFGNWGAREVERKVGDGVTTAGSKTVTSASAGFSINDKGRPISGPGIPSSATISSINSATSVVISSNATTTATAVSLTIGINDPVCIGVSLIGCNAGSNTPDHASVAQFTTTIGSRAQVTFSAFTWPINNEIEYVALRLVHSEQFTNLKPSITVSGPGGSCTFDSTSTPALDPTGSHTGVEVSFILPADCSPTSQARLIGTTVRYTVTCATAGAGRTDCGSGGTNKPRVGLDAVVFDYNYKLGNEGGTPSADFTATAGSTTVSANATFGDTVQVSDYQVT
jgi:hypothetical protein